ncbi:alginate export family protein [Muricauda oceani]|uniref:Alginate export family protein n=1 Tax=Flagellimonas oceani TaxID=2698672 RepID=A0A6G7J024_9FLAO|nr:alginate export family protein [Allomuricauda oceani]MBW8243690.1 alginate export family protein [Allomuricauda oceani]QII43948.1 alginate export family protein [Allomuricauda oceani]
MNVLKAMISLVIFWIVIADVALAQEKGTYRFALLRQNDSVPRLDNRNGLSWYRSLKHLYVSENNQLTLGGSWRGQAESFVNEEFSTEGRQDNIWFLNRLLFHAHLKLGDRFETFAELGSSLIEGKNNLSPVDKDVLYVNQLFVAYEISSLWTLEVGRRNIRLGSGRLVDIREGPNVRRSFDMAELRYHTKVFEALSFFSVPVRPEPGAFDNGQWTFDETFSGLYTTTHFADDNYLDAYVLYQKEDGAIYQSGTDNERRVSIGARHVGTVKGFTYNNEVVYQMGSFGNQDISAWTLSLQVEAELKVLGKDFDVGIKTEAISGDKNSTDGKMNTFDALYPRGAYFGRVARFGPSNLIDVHPYVNTTFNKLSLEVDYAAFWRYSLEDGVYGAAMTLDYPSLNDQRFIANQMGFIAGYRFNHAIGVELEGNVIFPGPFLRENNMDDTLFHMVLTTEVKF